MHLERLLSDIKRASPAKLPYAERVCAAGLAAQFLKPHLASGGDDPRVTTRKTLAANGVPLQCARVKHSKMGGLKPEMMYANKVCADLKIEREQNGQPRFTRDEFRTCHSEYISKFSTLPILMQEHYRDLAKNDHQDRQNVDMSGENDVAEYDDSLRFHLCDRSEPVEAEKIEETFQANAQAGSVGGYSRTCEVFRKELGETLAVQDEGPLRGPQHKPQNYTKAVFFT
jgi:hypothetical protein